MLPDMMQLLNMPTPAVLFPHARTDGPSAQDFRDLTAALQENTREMRDFKKYHGR